VGPAQNELRHERRAFALERPGEPNPQICPAAPIAARCDSGGQTRTQWGRGCGHKVGRPEGDCAGASADTQCPAPSSRFGHERAERASSRETREGGA
jgi:hypothetical protein